MFLHIQKAGIHIIMISAFVYILVNMIENLFHYNIGKFSNQEFKFEFPSQNDWIKIVLVMCVFALLQGILTYLLNIFFK